VVADKSESDPGLGIRHQHAWQAFTNLPRLQSAHDRLRWNTDSSRILSFNACTVCDEVERESVTECDAAACGNHAICARPYR
jgi:hypothetical protein